jgi:hypothetical protein
LFKIFNLQAVDGHLIGTSGVRPRETLFKFWSKPVGFRKAESQMAEGKMAEEIWAKKRFFSI